MDDGGVLYDQKDPRHVASIIHTMASESALYEEVLRAQDAALDRLRQKDFGAALSGFVDEVRRRPRAAAPRVAPEFWHQFEISEALEDIRQYRPAAFEALPKQGSQEPGVS